MNPFWHAVQVVILVGASLIVWPVLYKVAKTELLAALSGDKDA